ncbi:hypothetical protein JYQ62_06220 [Nostoc sp. UHCC 0702]|nr:hypothetical protein JYQ62_06220 [Nostoc sp. UHCC 0702]
MLDCLLISVDHALILVFSAGKKPKRLLKMLDCLLISVDHALISVFSAGKKLDCLLISVDHALILVFSASKRHIDKAIRQLWNSKK